MPAVICPNCNAGMHEVSRNGVLIDVCTQCRGVWLDRGELEKLLDFVRRLDEEWSRDGRDWDDDRRASRPVRKSGLSRIFDIFD